ncbi:hypothetical protein MMK25_33160, partial [Bacillus cereus]|nr:hypothetical protein [Bacillus cereus]
TNGTEKNKYLKSKKIEYSPHNDMVAITKEGEVTIEKLQERKYKLNNETSKKLPKDGSRTNQQTTQIATALTRTHMALCSNKT